MQAEARQGMVDHCGEQQWATYSLAKGDPDVSNRSVLARLTEWPSDRQRSIVYAVAPAADSSESQIVAEVLGDPCPAPPRVWTDAIPADILAVVLSWV